MKCEQCGNENHFEIYCKEGIKIMCAECGSDTDIEIPEILGFGCSENPVSPLKHLPQEHKQRK